MGWLWVKLVEVLAWWGPLLWGDLIRRFTGKLVNVVPVFVRRYPVEWGGVVGSSEFLVYTVLDTSGGDDFLHGWNIQVFVDHSIGDTPWGVNNCS